MTDDTITLEFPRFPFHPALPAYRPADDTVVLPERLDRIVRRNRREELRAAVFFLAIAAFAILLAWSR